MTGRAPKTHCIHGHDLAVTGRGYNGACLACRRARWHTAHPDGHHQEGHPPALKAAVQCAWEGTGDTARAIAARFGLVSKNAVIGLAARNNWKSRRYSGPGDGLFGRCRTLEIRMNAVMAETQPALDVRVKARAPTGIVADRKIYPSGRRT